MYIFFDSDQYWYGKIWFDGWISVVGGYIDVIELVIGVVLVVIGIGNVDDIDCVVISVVMV